MNTNHADSASSPLTLCAKFRILLVDDHPLVCEGLAARINRQADMTVCGMAATTADALAMMAENQPDLVIADLSLGGRGGLELICRIKSLYPRLPVLVLSQHDELLYAKRVLEAGARGYVMKSQASETVLVAVRRVLEGKIYLSENVVTKILDPGVVGPQGLTASPADALTDRELEVFEWIGRGLKTTEIAKRMHLSVKTVEGYRANIKRKFNLENGLQLAQCAFAFGWSEGRSLPKQGMTGTPM